MIKKEDIKIGSILQIRKVDLEDITSSGFIGIIDPNNIFDSFNIKVVDMVGGRCEISCPTRNESIDVDVDVDKLAKVSVFANESASEKSEQVSHPSHYAWLKDLCGVEPLDICRHLDFTIQGTLSSISCARIRWMATRQRRRSASRTCVRQCFISKTK